MFTTESALDALLQRADQTLNEDIEIQLNNVFQTMLAYLLWPIAVIAKIQVNDHATNPLNIFLTSFIRYRWNSVTKCFEYTYGGDLEVERKWIRIYDFFLATKIYSLLLQHNHSYKRRMHNQLKALDIKLLPNVPEGSLSEPEASLRLPLLTQGREME